MAYKTILVHLDQSERVDVRLEVGLRLGRAFDAHLVGLHALSVTPVPGYLVAEAGKTILDRQHDVAAERERQTHERFLRAVQASTVTKVEWRATEDDAARIVPIHARYADLVVAGQPESFETSGVERNFVERVFLTSGRPVLILPHSGPIEMSVDHALVAWNASREATRAITDALPLLQAAKRVDVVSFNPRRREGHGAIPGADIGLWLARHGVTVRVSEEHAEDVDVGNQLLSRAADLGSNFIVMGGYGHSRVVELVMGGATRTVLRSMTVPVLMAH
jgi:nucleotide-binding universal stress UspA family protein